MQRNVLQCGGGRRIAFIAALATFLGLAVLALFLGGVPHGPMSEQGQRDGVISFVSRTGLTIWPVYLYFGTLLALAGILAWAAPVPDLPTVLAPGLPSATRRALQIISAAIVLCVSLGAAFAFEPTDSFHEGEYVGYGPVFSRSETPFRDAVFIHGFGMDALPAIAARNFFEADRMVDAARIVRLTFVSFAWLGVFAILLAFSVRREDGASAPLAFSSMAGGIVALGMQPFGTLHFAISPRPMIHLWQMAAIVWSLLQPTKRTVTLGFLVAAGLAPLGFLYSYADAMSFAVELPVALAIVYLGSRHLLWRAVMASLVGVTVSVAAVVGAGSGAAFPAAFGDIFYWARYGHAIWGIELRGIRLSALLFQLTIYIGLGLAWLAFAWRRCGGTHAFAREQGALIFLLTAAVLGVRGQLGRPDGPHLMFAGLFASIVLVVVLSQWWGAITAWRHGPNIAAGIVLALLISLPTNAIWKSEAPFLARNIPRMLLEGPRLDSEVVDPGYLEAAAAVAPMLDGSSCFYTLTSEGLWYHLLRKPSCSRWHQLIYARTSRARAEVIQDLARRRPSLILFGNGMWSNSLDGVSVTESHPDVVRFVEENYEPVITVGGSKFWGLRR